MKLEKFLKKYRIEIQIKDEVEYRQVTISKHTGVRFRGTKLGSEIGRKRQFIVDLDKYPNTVMFTRQGLKDGAIGLAPKEVNKCIVTENMPTLAVNTELVDIDYLKRLLISNYFQKKVNELSTIGSAQKSIHERDLLKLEVDIPSIDKQKEIVKKIVSKENNFSYLKKEIQTQKKLISQLKQAILQEAIQGKLTEDWRKQNPGVEPASELLKRIKAEKAQLIKDKKIKKEKPLPPIAEDEIPFELPKGWVWCRLGEVSTFLNGKGFNSTDFKKKIGVKCIKITNVGVGEIIETDDTLPIEFENKYSAYLVYENDIVIALTRPYVADGLKVSLCPKSYNKSLLNQRVAVIRAFPHIQNKYIYKYLKTKFVLDGYKREFDSTGQQPNLKTEHVTNLIFPLPPLEEQKAIVEKVETLMQKCNALEQAIAQSEQHANMLMQAVLKEAFESKKEEVEV